MNPKTSLEQHIEPIACRIPVAVQVSGLSRSGIYRGIAAGQIEIRKAGKTTLVMFESLKRYVESLPAGGEREAA